MNKLVSKNPVLRFKQGKKILKFKDPSGPIDTRSSNEKFADFWKGMFSGWNPYTGFVGSNSKKQELKVSTDTHSSGMVTPSLEYELALRDYAAEKYWETQGNDPKALARTKAIFGNTPTITKKATSVRRQSSTPIKQSPTMFMGQGIEKGWKDNGLWNNTLQLLDALTEGLKLALQDAGINYRDARTLQQSLNNYISNSGLNNANNARISEDGKWGTLSQAALDFVLNRINSQKTAQPVLPFMNPLKITVTNHPPVIYLGNIPEFKPQILNVRNHSYNRADIRNLIRQAGFNPYDFHAVQRRALRKYLNGESDDVSQLGGTPLYRFTIPYTLQLTLELPQQQTALQTQQEKKLHPAEYKRGGLISRNPIERFKSNFRLVAQ